MRARSARDEQSNSPATDSDLWMVLAVIQPFRLDAVTLALEEIPGFGGMTVSDCRGFGHGKVADERVDDTGGKSHGPALHSEREPSGEVVDFTQKVRLEIAVVGRARADLVIETIARSAHTGRRGDGKVFAWPVSAAVRVRTFDNGARAL